MTTKHLILDDRMHPIKHSGTTQAINTFVKLKHPKKGCKRLVQNVEFGRWFAWNIWVWFFWQLGCSSQGVHRLVPVARCYFQ